MPSLSLAVELGLTVTSESKAELGQQQCSLVSVLSATEAVMVLLLLLLLLSLLLLLLTAAEDTMAVSKFVEHKASYGRRWEREENEARKKLIAVVCLILASAQTHTHTHILWWVSSPF